MKPKVLKKPTLVLMAGLPGVGKTTLAFELRRKLGGEWVVLEKDILKELLLEGISLNKRRYRFLHLEKDKLKKLLLEGPLLKNNFNEYTASWDAYEYSLKFTEDFLVNQQLSVILDTSLLHPFILERAKKLAARSGAQLKIILCEADEDTRQHRLRTRETRISQSKAHLVPKEAAKQFDQFDPSSYKKIGTERPLKKYIKEALKYVREPEQEVTRRQSAPGWFNSLCTPLLSFYHWIQRFVSPHTHKLPAFSRLATTQ